MLDQGYLIAEVQRLQQELQDERQKFLAMAILFVQAAGGRLVVPQTLAVKLDHTSWLQEERDPATGDRIYTTYQKPTEGHQG